MDHRCSPAGAGKAVFVAVFLLAAAAGSCKKEDAVPRRSTVQFVTDSVVLDQNQTDAIRMNLSVSDPADSAATIVLAIDDHSTASPSDYVTDPAASSGTLTLQVRPGATTASFLITPVNKKANDKTILFRIVSATGGLVPANSNLSALVTLKADTTAVPSVSTGADSLDFGEVDHGDISAAKACGISGSSLDGEVSVVASPHFQVSLDKVTFADSIGIASDEAAPGPATVYVRFVAATGANTEVHGTLTVSSAGASPKTVALTGTETGNAAAGLILNENFDYGPSGGNLTDLTTNWSGYSGSADPVQYVVGGLSFPGYGSSGTGGAVTVVNGPGSRQDIERVFTARSSGTIYVAQLISIASASASTAGDFFISLSNSDGDYLDRLYAKDDGKGKLLLGVVKNRSGSGDIVYSPAAFSYHTTYLVVICYDFSTAATSMYVISGMVPATQPAKADISTSSGTSPDAFDRIRIRQSTDAIRATIDGIRVADSWQDATGQ